MALSLKICEDQNGMYLVRIADKFGKRFVEVGSSDFKIWLAYQMQRKKYLISPYELDSIINAVKAKAKYEAESIQTFQRIGMCNGYIYYDLSNDKGEILQISTDNIKVLRKESNFAFLRTSHMREQVLPNLEADIDCIYRLKKYINVTGDNLKLLLIYVASLFIPDIPHPILVLTGSQGSAKSTLTRIIKRIVDPSGIGVATLPKSKREMSIHLSQEFLGCFDNTSGFSREIADLLCCVCTGAVMYSRQLYTDDELKIFSLKRSVILNGIMWSNPQSDLNDRVININLQRISTDKRRTEEELWNEFAEDLPYILGGIFKVLSTALSIKDSIKPKNLPRLADFGSWGCAIAEAMNIGTDTFLEIFERNRKNIIREATLSNPVACALINYMKNRQGVEEGVEQFYNILTSYAKNRNNNQAVPEWANSPSAFTRKLNELKIDLEAEGIYYTIQKTKYNKIISISNIHYSTEKKKSKKKA